MTNPFLAALLLVVPLIVRVKGILPPNDLWHFPNYGITADLFTWWKACVLIVLAFVALFCPRRNNLPDSIIIWIFLFLLFLLLSTIFSDYPYLSMYGVPNYNEGALCWLSYFIVMIVAIEIPQSLFFRLMRWSAYSVCGFAILQIFIPNPFMIPGIQQLISPAPIDIVKTHQIFGTLGNPNHLGLYCSLLLPFIIYDLDIVGLGMLLTALNSSHSRGALLGCGAGLTAVALNKNTVPKYMAIAAFMFMLLAMSFFIDHGRVYIWKTSLPLLWDTVLIGKGPSTFLNYIPQEQPGLYANGLIDRPHNMYIQVWHAAGLPALIALLSIIWLSFKQAQPKYQASIIGFSVAAFFTDSFVGVTPLFFALLGNAWRKEE